MFEPNNNEGKTMPLLDYQQGKFVYSLDKNLSSEINNMIPHTNYNPFNRMPNNPTGPFVPHPYMMGYNHHV